MDLAKALCIYEQIKDIPINISVDKKFFIELVELLLNDRDKLLVKMQELKNKN